MAKNDYYVIVYRVLMYLYNCLRQDEVVDMQKLTPEYLRINQRYFEYIFDTLNDEGLILNKAYYEDMLGKHLESDIMISPKGISFLHENSTIDKVKKSVKGIAVIISDIPGL
ncbi:YjcQ family protein [Ligilactobacillus salivarius]